MAQLRTSLDLSTLAGVPLTELMQLIYSVRSDLQRRFSIDDEFGRTVLLAWFHLFGCETVELPASELPQPRWDLLNDRCDELGPFPAHSFTKLQAVLWLACSSAIQLFDLNRLEDRLCIELLVSTCPIKPAGVRAIAPSKAALLFSNAPAPTFAPDLPIPICRRLSAIWRAREDLQIAFPRGSQKGAAALAVWLLNHGTRELDLSCFDHLTMFDRQYLLSPAPYHLSVPQSHMPRLLQTLWLSSSEIQRRFDLNSIRGQAEFLDWFKERGVVDYALECIFEDVCTNLRCCPPQHVPESNSAVENSRSGNIPRSSLAEIFSWIFRANTWQSSG